MADGGDSSAAIPRQQPGTRYWPEGWEHRPSFGDAEALIRTSERGLSVSDDWCNARNELDAHQSAPPLWTFFVFITRGAIYRLAEHAAGSPLSSKQATDHNFEPAERIRRSRYRSKTRGTTNARPHQRPVAQSTTTMTAIQTASSSRITSEDFRCRRSQFIVVLRYDQHPPFTLLRSHRRRPGIDRQVSTTRAPQPGRQPESLWRGLTSPAWGTVAYTYARSPCRVPQSEAG